MLCDAVLCYAMLCCAMLCYTTLCYAVRVGTWMLGLMFGAHASVWCVANVVQSLLMLAEPALFPLPACLPSDAELSASASDSQSDTSSSSGAKKGTRRFKPRAFPRYRTSEMAGKPFDAIVIGSGIGGLTTACLLSRAGRRVLVLEQHDKPGGCTHTFTELGGLFDSGIHYIGSADYLRFLLSYTASKPVPLVPIVDEDGAYDRIDVGGACGHVLYRAGLPQLTRELVDKFPHEEKGIRSYMASLKEVCQ